jgi:hypothetical protein
MYWGIPVYGRPYDIRYPCSMLENPKSFDTQTISVILVEFSGL